MKTFRVLLLLTAAVSAVRADVVKTISLDTSNLVFSPDGPFSLAFELADGSGTGDGNNSVTLSDFQFGSGGSAFGSPLFLIGSATGDLSSAVTLTDSDLANIFVQTFVGDTLSFNLSFTTNVDAGGTPDEFVFSILDSSLTPLPTTSSSSLSPFLGIDIDSANPAILTFDSALVPAPTVADAPSAVPEPSSAALMMIPLAGLGWVAGRKIRRA